MREVIHCESLSSLSSVTRIGSSLRAFLSERAARNAEERKKKDGAVGLLSL